jgi:hypothetical protein
MTIRTTASTQLALDVVALSAYASRGITQTLELIDQASDLRRTVNFEMVNFGDDLAHKYKTTVTGKDQRPPSFDGIFPGAGPVTLHCVTELSYLTGAAGAPHRSVVPGSSRVEGDLTFYRPILTVMVTAFENAFDEYNADWNWTITFEEI